MVSKRKEKQIISVELWNPRGKWDPTLDYVFAGLPLNESINTSAVAYHVWLDGTVEPVISSFEISEGDIFENDLRAVRERRKRRGKSVPPLSRGAMDDFAMIVLFGPQTNPDRAVRALKKVADVIEKCGLITGYAAKNSGEYYAKEFVKAAPEATLPD
jgi:hypothetical protein